jgi:hypothetical protein
MQYHLCSDAQDYRRRGFAYLRSTSGRFPRIRHMKRVIFPEGSLSNLFTGFQQAHENIKVNPNSKVNYMIKIKTGHLDPPHLVHVSLKDSEISQSVWIPSLRLEFQDTSDPYSAGINIREYESKTIIGRIVKTGKRGLRVNTTIWAFSVTSARNTHSNSRRSWDDSRASVSIAEPS